MTDQQEHFDAVMEAFAEYVAHRKRFIALMEPCGIVTRNVDPLADFAEIVVAREFGGQIRKRVNKDFDVVGHEGNRIQVKSLRVSSDRPRDNWLNWYGCTRRKVSLEGSLLLIDADVLTVVVFVDCELYALLTFPIRAAEKFPVVEVKDLFLAHVDKLLNAAEKCASSGVTAKRFHSKL